MSDLMDDLIKTFGEPPDFGKTDDIEKMFELGKKMGFLTEHSPMFSNSYKGLRGQTLQLIKIAKEVLDQVSPLPIRGLYYQIISRPDSPIEHNQKEYKKVCKAMQVARERGIIPWDAFVDETRRVIAANGWVDLKDYTQSLADYYRRDRLQSQDTYLELWLEKEALAQVLEPFVYKYGIKVRIGRGYTSSSALNKFATEVKGETRPIKILYCGDWDPSGLDIDRSFSENLYQFFRVRTEVERVALTEQDIKTLPQNFTPVKPSDPRSKNYVRQYGNKSWELDALSVPELRKRVVAAIERNIDMTKFGQQLADEEAETKKLKTKLKAL